MWTYKTSADWTEGKKGTSACEGKSPIDISTPPEFGGPEGFWTPEDLLTSAVVSCLMTSTLFFADRAKIKMISYKSKIETINICVFSKNGQIRIIWQHFINAVHQGISYRIWGVGFLKSFD